MQSVTRCIPTLEHATIKLINRSAIALAIAVAKRAKALLLLYCLTIYAFKI